MVDSGYIKEENNKDKTSYYGDFLKLEKDIGNNIKVSTDILIKEVLDRQTNATFSADWVFDNSEIITLRGKTITEELKLRIINLDALVAMKMISCRISDIRDVFMLMVQAKNIEWIKKEVSERYNFDDRLKKIQDKITSKKFKDDLQGVYGYIEQKIFDKHKNGILRMN